MTSKKGKPTNPINTPVPDGFVIPSGSGGYGTSGDNKDRQIKPVTMTHCPVQCPITGCTSTITMTSLLAHILYDHIRSTGMQCREIYADIPLTLVFNPSILKFRRNHCIGVLAYGGVKDESNGLPAQRGICARSVILPAANANLADYLPVMIIACLTSWSGFLKNKELAAKYTNPENTSQQVLIIWLVSIPTTKPVNYTITLFKDKMDSSRSQSRRLRSIMDNQDPSEFVPNHPNYAILTNSEMELLCGNDGIINMEVMIKK